MSTQMKTTDNRSNGKDHSTTRAQKASRSKSARTSGNRKSGNSTKTQALNILPPETWSEDPLEVFPFPDDIEALKDASDAEVKEALPRWQFAKRNAPQIKVIAALMEVYLYGSRYELRKQQSRDAGSWAEKEFGLKPCEASKLLRIWLNGFWKISGLKFLPWSTSLWYPMSEMPCEHLTQLASEGKLTQGLDAPQLEELLTEWRESQHQEPIADSPPVPLASEDEAAESDADEDTTEEQSASSISETETRETEEQEGRGKNDTETDRRVRMLLSGLTIKRADGGYGGNKKKRREALTNELIEFADMYGRPIVTSWDFLTTDEAKAGALLMGTLLPFSHNPVENFFGLDERYQALVQLLKQKQLPLATDS